MLLEQYNASGLLFNTNFLEQTSTSGLFSYRGELVLIQGEVADDKGHTKPPVKVMRGAVLLADEKIRLLIGALDDISMVNDLLEKYQNDFAADMKAVLFVVNIDKPAQVSLDGANIVFIPMVQGVPWNEVIDELGLEKSDFKGQSAADKLLTLQSEIVSYKPKYPAVSLDEVLASATDVQREAWGAV
ncbi:MAG: hypothetical protein ABW068_02035 [Candidatus Thiodiazotropha sp.]